MQALGDTSRWRGSGGNCFLNFSLSHRPLCKFSTVYLSFDNASFHIYYPSGSWQMRRVSHRINKLPITCSGSNISEVQRFLRGASENVNTDPHISAQFNTQFLMNQFGDINFPNRRLKHWKYKRNPSPVYDWARFLSANPNNSVDIISAYKISA